MSPLRDHFIVGCKLSLHRYLNGKLYLPKPNGEHLLLETVRGSFPALNSKGDRMKQWGFTHAHSHPRARLRLASLSRCARARLLAPSVSLNGERNGETVHSHNFIGKLETQHSLGFQAPEISNVSTHGDFPPRSHVPSKFYPHWNRSTIECLINL